MTEDEMLFLEAYRAAVFGRRVILSETLRLSLAEFFKAMRRAYDAAKKDTERRGGNSTH